MQGLWRPVSGRDESSVVEEKEDKQTELTLKEERRSKRQQVGFD